MRSITKICHVSNTGASSCICIAQVYVCVCMFSKILIWISSFRYIYSCKSLSAVAVILTFCIIIINIITILLLSPPSPPPPSPCNLFTNHNQHNRPFLHDDDDDGDHQLELKFPVEHSLLPSIRFINCLRLSLPSHNHHVFHYLGSESW